MAYEVSDPSGHSVLQTPEPFVWTEDAHCLYLSFLEDAFVNDLYSRHFCSLDICGFSPPFPAHHGAASSCLAAGSPSSAPLEGLSMIPLPPEPISNTEVKSHCKRPRTGSKRSSTKRKGKWSSDDVGFDNNQQALGPSIGIQENVPFLEQPGSSSQSFECCERVVPKGPRRGSKRSLSKHNVGLCNVQRTGTDQV